MHYLGVIDTTEENLKKRAKQTSVILVSFTQYIIFGQPQGVFKV